MLTAGAISAQKRLQLGLPGGFARRHRSPGEPSFDLLQRDSVQRRRFPRFDFEHRRRPDSLNPGVFVEAANPENGRFLM
jgi:hypothetical protein